MFQAMLVQYLRARFELLRSHSGCPVDAFKPFCYFLYRINQAMLLQYLRAHFGQLEAHSGFLSMLCTFLYRLSDVSSYASAIFTDSF